MTAPRQPIHRAPQRLRQRQRADGTWRVWWEPKAADRALGFAVVELSADKPTWSVREAERLNAEADRARKAGRRIAPASTSRSVTALIEAYRTSRQYLELAPATRKTYDSLLRTIDAKWGRQPVAEFSKPVMATWYDSLLAVHSVRNAQAIIRMASGLFAFAEIKGWRAENSNPCARLKVKTPGGRRRVLSWDETDHLVATADRMGLPAVGTAILLSVAQGMRAADVLLAAPATFRLVDAADPGPGDPARVLAAVFATSKSRFRKVVAAQLHPEITDRIRLTIARLPAGAPRLLVDDATGRPFADAAGAVDFPLFAKRFAAVRAEAAKAMPALASVQFRDLRRTQASRARQGGISREDLGDLLANTIATSDTLAEVYTPSQLATASRAVLGARRPTKQSPKENKG